MKIMRLRGISKKYALRAAHYRRVARTASSKLDFSEKALRELYAWESSGIGSVDKAEFLSTPLERLHNTSKLSGVVAGTFFAWQKS